MQVLRLYYQPHDMNYKIILHKHKGDSAMQTGSKMKQ